MIYRGYLKIGNGGEIQIANIRNPPEGGNVPGGHHDSRTKVIDFTRQANTYMRGRIDGAGLNATTTGTLYPGHYNPGSWILLQRIQFRLYVRKGWLFLNQIKIVKTCQILRIIVMITIHSNATLRES